MKKIIISIAAVLLMGCSSWVVNSVSESNPLTPLTMSVKNRLLIPSDDGQQGVATDGEFIYVQNSQQLFKYLLNGKLIKDPGWNCITEASVMLRVGFMPL